MPYFDVEEGDESLDISPSEFVDECNSVEIAELIDCLVKEGHALVANTGAMQTLGDEIWIENIQKLASLRMKLTREEEEFIENLVKKY